MTPRPEAIPNPSFDDQNPALPEPDVVPPEIADDPPAKVVLGSVKRLAAFSARTGRWHRPAPRRRRRPTGGESKDVLVD
jgi:hypothetical protein